MGGICVVSVPEASEKNKFFLRDQEWQYLVWLETYQIGMPLHLIYLNFSVMKKSFSDKYPASLAAESSQLNAISVICLHSLILIVPSLQ